MQCREAFTHPKTVRDVGPFEVFGTMHSAIEWLLGSWKSLLMSCMRARGFTPKAPPHKPRYRFDRKKLEAFAERQKEFDEVLHDGSYLHELSRIVFGLMTDTKRAVHAASTGAVSRTSLEAGFRNATRFLFSEIEGTVFVAARYLHRYGFLQEPPTKELLTGSHVEVQARIVDTLEDFSRRFGNEVSVARNSDGRDAFLRARAMRHRLIHPKGVADLQIADRDMDDFFATLGWWRSEAHPCLELSDRIVQLSLARPAS